MAVTKFEIQILTRPEMAGALQMEQSLQRQIGQAKALGKDYADLDAQLKRVQASIAASKDASGGGILGKLTELPGLDRLSGLFTTLASGPIAAVTAGLGLATAALHKFMGAEVTSAKLDAALAQTGQLTGEFRDKVKALSSELAEVTGKSGGEWTAVLTRLIQFGASGDNINQAADAVKNMAGINGSLEESAQAVSRALQGNFMMFSRIGIKVPENISQIEKLDFLYKELALRGGGQLEAQTKTLSGSFDRLGHAAGGLMKSFGGWLDHALNLKAVLYGLGETMNWFAGIIKFAIPQLEGLHNAAKPTIQTFEDSADAAKSMAEAIEKIKTESAEAADQMNRVITRASEMKKQADAYAAAVLKRDLAQINVDLADGKISPAEAEARKAARGVKASKAAQEREDIESNVIIDQAAKTKNAYNDQTVKNLAEIDAQKKAVADAEDKAPHAAKAKTLRSQIAALQLEVTEANNVEYERAVKKEADRHGGGSTFNSWDKSTGVVSPGAWDLVDNPDAQKRANLHIQSLVRKLTIENRAAAGGTNPEAEKAKLAAMEAKAAAYEAANRPGAEAAEAAATAEFRKRKARTQTAAVEAETAAMEAKAKIDEAKRKEADAAQKAEDEKLKNAVKQADEHFKANGRPRSSLDTGGMEGDIASAGADAGKAFDSLGSAVIAQLTDLSAKYSTLESRINNLRLS